MRPAANAVPSAPASGAPPASAPAPAPSSAFRISGRDAPEVGAERGDPAARAVVEPIPREYRPPQGRPGFKSPENPLGLSSIHACIHKKWIVKRWKRGAGGVAGLVAAEQAGEVRRTPFKCRSGRHAGECRKARAAENYGRIKKALAPVPVEHVSFAVLTLDQGAFRREGEPAAQSRYRAFRELNSRWTPLRKRLVRRFGGMHFVCTVEEHRSGWPHLNVLIVNAALGLLCRSDGWVASSIESHFDRKLLEMVTACGFGRVLTVEGARSKEAVGQYIAKLASEVESPATVDPVSGQLIAEVTKITQAPVHAPRHFRALRSSQRFLPPARPPSEWTGVLADAEDVRVGAGYKKRRAMIDDGHADVAAAARALDEATTATDAQRALSDEATAARNLATARRWAAIDLDAAVERAAFNRSSSHQRRTRSGQLYDDDDRGVTYPVTQPAAPSCSA